MRSHGKTLIRALAAPLTAVAIACAPLAVSAVDGIPRFTPGKALSAFASWFAGMADGSSFRYVIGATEWSLLDTAPRFLGVSFLYVALPGSLGLALGMAVSLALKGRKSRGAGSALLDSLYAVPDFIMALALQLLVLVAMDLGGFKLASLSYDGSGSVLIALPLILMAFYPFAYAFRVCSRTARDAAGSDYINYARAKGLSERAIRFRHVGAAVIPSMQAELPSILALMQTNLFIAEYVFSLPGITRLLFTQAFVTRMSQWFPPSYQFHLAASILLGILIVYAASWLFFRLALAAVRRVMTGER